MGERCEARRSASLMADISVMRHRSPSFSEPFLPGIALCCVAAAQGGLLLTSTKFTARRVLL